MKKLKEFLKNKKVNNQFKGLGEGYALNAPASSTNASQSQPLSKQSTSQKSAQPSQDAEERRARAAEAIERRLNSGDSKLTAAQRKLKLQVRRELEKEEEEKKFKEQDEKKFPTSKPTVQSNQEIIEDNMLYTCDLLEGLAMKRSDMYDAMEQFLRAQLNEEPVDASVLILHSLNPVEKWTAAKACLQAYIKNIITDPTNQKFLRIRCQNKVFMEKVRPVKGAVEFLNAIGFVEKNILNEVDKQQETYLVLEDAQAVYGFIQEAAIELEEGSPIYLRVFRDPKVFLIDPSKPIPYPEISPDFYKLSIEELKAEQKARTEEIERMTTFRTRKMREADAQNGPKREFKYTLIRIRFPNNYILQGIFNVHESISAVREFIEKNLENILGSFELTLPYSANTKVLNEKTLLDYELVPTALLHFQWGNDVTDEYEEKNSKITYLSQSNEMCSEKL